MRISAHHRTLGPRVELRGIQPSVDRRGLFDDFRPIVCLHGFSADPSAGRRGGSRLPRSQWRHGWDQKGWRSTALADVGITTMRPSISIPRILIIYGLVFRGLPPGCDFLARSREEGSISRRKTRCRQFGGAIRTARPPPVSIDFGSSALAGSGAGDYRRKFKVSFFQGSTAPLELGAC